VRSYKVARERAAERVIELLDARDRVGLVIELQTLIEPLGNDQLARTQAIELVGNVSRIARRALEGAGRDIDPRETERIKVRG